MLKTAPNSHTKHHHALHSWTSLGDPSHKKAHAPRISIAGSESRRRDIEKKTLRELPLPASSFFSFPFPFSSVGYFLPFLFSHFPPLPPVMDPLLALSSSFSCFILALMAAQSTAIVSWYCRNLLCVSFFPNCSRYFCR